MDSEAAASNLLIALGVVFTLFWFGLAGSAVQIVELAKSINKGKLSLSDSDSIGKITSFIWPAAAICILGYCYTKLKALSFSDVMFVTKQHMANAFASVLKKLKKVSDDLQAYTKNLAQRLEKLDGKIDEQHEVFKAIMHKVTDVKTDLSRIAVGIESIQQSVASIAGKLIIFEKKQDLANADICYLCQVADGIMHVKFFQGKESCEELKPYAVSFYEAAEKLKELHIPAEDIKHEEMIDLDLNNGITRVKDGEKPIAKGLPGSSVPANDELSDVLAQIVGLSFSNVMFVTKQDLEKAIAPVSKQIKQLSDDQAALEAHLTCRLENLYRKIDKELKFSKAIEQEVYDVKTALCQIGSGIKSIQQMVAALEEKLSILEKKQDVANAGIWYLCQVASGIKDARDAKFFQEACEKLKPNAVSFSEATEKSKGLYIQECIDLDLNKGNTEVKDGEKPTGRVVHRTNTTNLASIKRGSVL